MKKQSNSNDQLKPHNVNSDQESASNTSGINRLLAIMRKLRDPENGCPWDVEQDFSSIAPYTLEEAYEVVDAINQEDWHNLKSELGDLLLQTVFHCQIASEKGLFEFKDVVEAICQKMINRHPHVFSDDKKPTLSQQNANWERMKDLERNKSDNPESVVDNIANALPALSRAYKLQKSVARVGFDWSDIQQVIGKVSEELFEFAEEINADDKVKMKEEFGDLLFSIVNLGRHAEIDAESALRSSNEKFKKRFKIVEELIRNDGQDLFSADLETLDNYWEAAKKSE